MYSQKSLYYEYIWWSNVDCLPIFAYTNSKLIMYYLLFLILIQVIIFIQTPTIFAAVPAAIAAARLGFQQFRRYGNKGIKIQSFNLIAKMQSLKISLIFLCQCYLQVFFQDLPRMDLRDYAAYSYSMSFLYYVFSHLTG